MNQAKIGIVIPCYNIAHNVLRKCISSIFNQSYINYVLIAVNDASKNGTLRYLERFKEKFDSQNFIILDKKKNEGVDRARFSGLEICRSLGCEYVTFIDADDWVEPDFLSTLMDVQVHTSADVVQCEMVRHFGPKRIYKSSTPSQLLDDKYVAIERHELMDKWFISFFGVNYLSVNMCGKLFRLETIEKAGLAPSGYKMGEDLFFSMKLFPFINTYSVTRYKGYNYRWGGLTSGYNPTLLSDLKKMYHEKLDWAEKYHCNQARTTSAIELKNVLMSDLDQRLVFKYRTNNLREDLSQELKDPAWRDMNLLLKIEKYQHDPVVKAIAENNPERLISIAKESYNAKRNQRMLKKIISPLLRLYNQLIP